MKKQTTFFGYGLMLLALSAQAQDIPSGLPVSKKLRTTESTITYRLGRQGVSLGGLNQLLEQTGYPDLSNQFTVFGIATEASSQHKPWALLTQFDYGLRSNNQGVTNGTNTVRAAYFQYGIGAGYRLVHTNRFTLTPKLMVSPSFFTLTVTRNGAPAPSVAAALVNPGSQQTATFKSGTFVGDLGLSGQYQFVYSARTKQIETDCGTATVTRQRSLVFGFDAGYRLAANARLSQSTSDQTVNSSNPTVNMSGWYVTARLGFGTRYNR